MRNRKISGIIVLFSTFIIMQTHYVSSYEELSNHILLRNDNGNILYVGGTGPRNFSKIQDAIDNASNNDTIFVYNDSSPYHENIVINKSISLYGENKTTTAIDALGSSGNAVTIKADRVVFSGFSILNWGSNIYSEIGMYISSNNCTIVGNIFSGTYIWYGYLALNLDHSNDNLISGNIVSHCILGITMDYCSRNNISKNFITDTFEAGILLYLSHDNNISKNLIVNNSLAMRLENSKYNKINFNEISNNIYGMDIITSVQNIITKNNFRNNVRYHVFDVFSVKAFWRNSWDANYWNRTRLLPKIIFGLLDLPGNNYISIPWLNVDWHPAKKPYNIPLLT